jgi:UDP-N-acetylmuramoyl-L-alanyl-D-glutamate--2,6-diaminopimelate ligase
MLEKILRFLEKYIVPKPLYQCAQPIYHFLLALLGAVLYGFPSKKIKVIGVTGTNGKTTTVEMASKILEEARYKIALLNSIRFKVGEKEEPNMLKMTMPGRFKLQKFLRQAVNTGCQYVVLEVTSEGIKQHRHKFIDFETAVFTNLAPEHIESHGGFEKYREAKGKLFQASKKIHIINLDDENAEYFLRFPANKKIDYSLKTITPTEQYHRLVCGTIISDSYPLVFSVDGINFKLNLLGEFNVYNALAAICVGISQGINLETCKRALEKIEGIPGRMELVISEPFKVFIDYAFTPNALRKVYEILRNSKWGPAEGWEGGGRVGVQITNSRMICVLGACGGGRDKWKRPILGEIASKYCDEVIVTNEDPYDENPMEIINQVVSGAEKISLNQFTPLDNSVSNGASQHKSAVYKILDRREAIKKSLELAKPNDVIIITGKGCEPWICLAKGKKIPWDDREVTREEFKKLQK